VTYLDQANLASEPKFRTRLGAALAEQGRSHVAEPLGRLIMNSPEEGVAAFVPFVASAPGFGDKFAQAGNSDSITDGDILSAVQTSWDDVNTVQFPPEE